MKTYAVRLIGSQFIPETQCWVEDKILHIEEGFKSLGDAQAWATKKGWKHNTGEGTKIENVKVELGY